MVLFTINETTLVRWYKNLTRMNELKLLLQGHPLELEPHQSEQHLSPTLEKQPIPPPPEEPFSFEEQPDTRDEARVRRRSDISLVTSQDHQQPNSCQGPLSGGGKRWERPLKNANSTPCGQTMSLGDHTQSQVKGQRYCPTKDGISKEEWLTKKRTEEKAKKSKHTTIVIVSIVELGRAGVIKLTLSEDGETFLSFAQHRVLHPPKE